MPFWKTFSYMWLVFSIDHFFHYYRIIYIYLLRKNCLFHCLLLFQYLFIHCLTQKVNKIRSKYQSFWTDLKSLLSIFYMHICRIESAVSALKTRIKLKRIIFHKIRITILLSIEFHPNSGDASESIETMLACNQWVVENF